MDASISVPLWLFVILALLAAWAAGVLLLAPGMRWFFRRRINAVIEELNTRLRIELPSFKLTRREVLIDRLFHDPRIQAAAEAHARESGEALVDVRRRIDRYAREIVPSFNAYLYFRVGYWLAKSVARLLYRVRLGYADEAGLAAVDPKSTVVFVMNHRSNMDYVLVAFLAAEQAALSYAVGEWARVWPLQALIRSMGAFFVRRNSGDPLYRTVLARYVSMATEAGVPQALFPEGGLTVDGALRQPRFGLLDYMVKSFRPDGGRDLVFIPVGLNYDRVLEDRSQLLKLGERRRRGMLGAVSTTLTFIARNLWQMLTGNWHRFGYACVNFGSPVSMRRYVAMRGTDFPALDDEARRREVEALGRHLMQAIGGVIPVVPVALVAQVFGRDAARALSELEIKSAACDLLRDWEAHGAHIYIPRHDRDYAIGVGLRMLTLRRIVEERDGLFRAVPENLPVLAYYANSVAHFAGAVAQAVPLAEPAAATAVT
ncbi:MAG: glycerol-3-phosphate 1-O-acyltransferase [Betaproteobacteria bacterium]|nr:MAG: glycerol-3-phosphate 1-O-acyltransferase [Betaproteobacteria bacterium]